MNTLISTPLRRLALCIGLAAPLAGWSADIATPAASKPAAAKKVDAKMPKAKSTNSAPGCDESNSPGKKLPSPPKCPPDLKAQPAAKQQ